MVKGKFSKFLSVIFLWKEWGRETVVLSYWPVFCSEFGFALVHPLSLEFQIVGSSCPLVLSRGLWVHGASFGTHRSRVTFQWAVEVKLFPWRQANFLCFCLKWVVCSFRSCSMLILQLYPDPSGKELKEDVCYSVPPYTLSSKFVCGVLDRFPCVYNCLTFAHIVFWMLIKAILKYIF